MPKRERSRPRTLSIAVSQPVLGKAGKARRHSANVHSDRQHAYRKSLPRRKSAAPGGGLPLLHGPGVKSATASLPSSPTGHAPSSPYMQAAQVRKKTQRGRDDMAVARRRNKRRQKRGPQMDQVLERFLNDDSFKTVKKLLRLNPGLRGEDLQAIVSKGLDAVVKQTLQSKVRAEAVLWAFALCEGWGRAATSDKPAVPRWDGPGRLRSSAAGQIPQGQSQSQAAPAATRQGQRVAVARQAVSGTVQQG